MTLRHFLPLFLAFGSLPALAQTGSYVQPDCDNNKPPVHCVDECGNSFFLPYGSTCPETSGSNPFDATGGGLHRQVDDLTARFGVGEHRLQFSRHYISRTHPANVPIFGDALHWRHSYQWQMVSGFAAGSTTIRTRTLYFPNGDWIIFKETAANNGNWQPPSNNPGGTLVNNTPTGTNHYYVDLPTGYRYHFEQLTATGGGTYFLIRDFKDPIDTLFSFAYLSDGRLSTVSEPGGRSLTFNYTQIEANRTNWRDLHTITSTNVPITDQWKTITIPTTEPASRYWRYQSPENQNGDMAELKFFNAANVQIFGTPIGASPPEATGQEFGKALDGNIQTYYKHIVDEYGFCGVDFGAPTVVSRIEYYPRHRAGNNTSPQSTTYPVTTTSGNPPVTTTVQTPYTTRLFGGKFQSSNVAPVLIDVLNSVILNSGDLKATFRYALKPATEFATNWVTLSGVNYSATSENISVQDNPTAYGEGVYAYSYLRAGRPPYLAQASDPNYAGAAAGKEVAYEFWQSAVNGSGVVKREANLHTDELIAFNGRLPADSPNVSRVTTPQGTRVFEKPASSANRITKKTDATGKIWGYTYASGTSGLLTKITGPDSQTYSIARNAMGQITQVNYGTVATGAGAVFKARTYDARGRLLNQRDELGRTTIHTRDTTTGRITRTDYPDGTYEQNLTFNAFNQVLTTRLRNGLTESYTYLADGRPASHTRSDGSVENYLLPQWITSPPGLSGELETARIISQNGVELSSEVTQRNYNDGRVNHVTTSATSTSTYDASETYFGHDSIGNLISRVNRLRYNNGTHINEFTTTEFDSYGRMLTRTDAGGLITSYIYTGPLAGGSGCGSCSATSSNPTRIDYPGGRSEGFTYDAEGRMLTRTRQPGAPDAATTTYAYYPTTGQLWTVKDPYNRTTTYVYNSRGWLASTTDPVGRVTSTLYNNAGQPTQMTAPTGAITTYNYDTPGRPTTTISPAGTTTRTYDAATGRVASITSAAGRVTAYGYDVRDRVTSVTLGFGSAAPSTSTKVYDALGRVSSSKDGLLRETLYTYDRLSRVLTTTQPGGRITTNLYWNWYYNPNNFGPPPPGAVRRHVRTTSADATVREVISDYRGKVLSEQDSNATVSYTYDAEGRMLSLTDGNANSRTWLYDPHGRLSRKTYPDGTYHEYTWRLDNKPFTRRTPAGAIETSTYLANGLLLKRDWSDATEDVNYLYDTFGRLATISDVDTTTAFAYDTLNRKTSETQTVANLPARTIGYSYTGEHEPASITYPDGTLTEYTYTPRGEMLTVSSGGPPPVATYTYDAAGRPTGHTMDNGTVATQTYVPTGEVDALIHTKTGTTFAGMDYSIDSANGRRLSQVSLNTGTSGQSDFGYDSIGQVTSASYLSSPWSKSSDQYSYDASGNRTATTEAPTPGVKAWTSNALDQTTSIGGGLTMTYDSSGNMLTAMNPGTGRSTLTWDAENRLLTSSGPPTSTTRNLNRYDPFHRLVLTEAQTLTAAIWTTQSRTRSVLDKFNLIEESTYPGSNGTAASETFRYTWGRDLGDTLYAAGGVGGLLLMEKVTAGAPEPWWYHHDANGNVLALTDATGTAAKSARYDAFGQMATWTAPAFASPILSVHHNRHWFSTKPLTIDPSGGLALHFYGFRWYLPQLGRWPSRDPAEEVGGINLYGMVGNSAPNWVDVLGLAKHVQCDFQITAGHSGKAANDARKDWEKNKKSCDQYFAAGCGTSPNGGYVWPNKASHQTAMEDGRPGTRPDDLTIGEELTLRLAEAVAAAEAACLNGCCGSTVEINIDCQPSEEMKIAISTDPVAKKLCQQARTKVNCSEVRQK
jgi:RHS repeat-associated protein